WLQILMSRGTACRTVLMRSRTNCSQLFRLIGMVRTWIVFDVMWLGIDQKASRCKKQETFFHVLVLFYVMLRAKEEKEKKILVPASHYLFLRTYSLPPHIPDLCYPSILIPTLSTYQHVNLLTYQLTNQPLTL